MGSMTRREFVAQAAGALSAMAIVPELSASPLCAAAGMRVGLVGVGRQGRAIATELERIEGVAIAAYCDVDEPRRQWGTRRAADAKAFADHGAMLDAMKDLDAVVVATPTHRHTQVVLDSLRAGKHVYCEAPLAHTVEDCVAIANAAGKSGRVVHVGFEGRSNPVYKLARTFFRTDAARDPVSAETHAFQKNSWRVPGADAAREKELNWRLDPAVSLGLPGEVCAHQLDVVRWFMGSNPASARGGGSVRLHQDGRTIHDTISGDVVLANGVRVVVGASLANSYGGRYEVLRGTNAAMKLAWTHGWMFKEADAPTQGWEVYANRQQFHNDEGITLIADATKLASQGKLKEGVGLPFSPLYYALADFVRSVTEKKPSACDAGVGAASTIVAIALAKAVQSGQEAPVDAKALASLG